MPRRPDDDLPDVPEDDVVYEDFDDLVADVPDPDVLDAIDLDEIDGALDEPLAEPLTETEQVPAPEPAAEPETQPEPTGEPEPAPSAQPKPTPRPRTRKPKPETPVTPPAPQTDQPEPAAEPHPSAATETAPPPEPAPDVRSPLTVYRALLLLGDEAAEQVRSLRVTGGVVAMPPPGVTLTAVFKTDTLDAVELAISEWTQTLLPLEISLTGVLAEVRKSNQYIAAWTLADDPRLEQAQRALSAALGSLVEPQNAVPGRFTGRIVIGDHVLPVPYPTLIAAMQRDFEPVTWTVERVVLVQMQPQINPTAWAMTRLFTTTPGDYHTRPTGE